MLPCTPIDINHDAHVLPVFLHDNLTTLQLGCVELIVTVTILLFPQLRAVRRRDKETPADEGSCSIPVIHSLNLD